MNSVALKGLDKFYNIPDKLHVGLVDCIVKGELVAKLKPLKIKAMDFAIKYVKPKFCKFYHEGQHLKDLDFKVGMLITEYSDLIYTDKNSREEIEIVYLKKIYALIGLDRKPFCPYYQAESFYLQSVEAVSKDLALFSEIDLSQWSSDEKIKFINFITPAFLTS